MLHLKKIAVTGGVSSGKSTLCRFLERRGFFSVYSDRVVHDLLSQDSSCIAKIVSLLGEGVRVDGKVDRKRVADEVFADPKKLRAMEAILHPLVMKEIEKEYQQASAENRCSFFLVEIPLVQEIEETDYFDFIVAVYTDERLAKERFIKQGFSEKEYAGRMGRQWDVEKKALHADLVIENNGTEEELEKEASKLISRLTKSR